jgi:4-hydroxy-tetrahydrodipicolinate synthase
VTLLQESERGVFVIAVTPFAETGEIDFKSIDRMTEFYLELGVSGMTVLGMMGEASKLTADESRWVIKRVLERVNGRVPVVVGVSSPGFSGIRELSRDAMDVGAAGVMVAPQTGLHHDEAISSYFEFVGETLGSGIPFVIQDFPLSTHVHMTPSVINRIIERVPNCVMLKHEDWPGLAKISALRAASNTGAVRRISILAGNGGLFLPEELARGADGAMTGFAYPEMMVDVCAAVARGDVEYGHDVFDIYLPLIRYEQQPGVGLSVRKYLLWKRGAIATPFVRQPNRPLSPDDITEIEYLRARQEHRLKELCASNGDASAAD